MGEDAPVRGLGDEPPGQQKVLAAGTASAAMVDHNATVRPSLFVSYRRSQLARVEPVVRALEAAGIDCFLDQDAIDALADFPERIRQGIGASHALLAWWSADYAASDHCMAEFKLAWQHARRHSSDVGRQGVGAQSRRPAADHIAAGELNSQNFLTPSRGGAHGSSGRSSFARACCALLPEGPLASERQRERSPTAA